MDVATQGVLRIGAVSYLNTTPLIEGLEKMSGVRLTLSPPSGLVEMLLRDELDVALAPVIDAQRSPEPLALLPVGGISSDGPTHTVRLFSRAPIHEIERVRVDAESHTSVALLRVLLARLFDTRPEIVEFDARSAARSGAWPDAALVIGDKVVAAAPGDDSHPHQLDLGEAWRDWTGLPFVYAMWMCRASRALESDIRLAAAALDRQRRRNAARMNWVARRHAAPHGWAEDLARRYLGEMLEFQMGPRHVAAVERFFDEAHAVGALPERRPVVWA